jgi:hypothetical protein
MKRMKKKNPSPKLPPPLKKKKRQLSLKAAVAAISRSETPISSRGRSATARSPKARDDADQDIQTSLIELQADIIVREGLINDKEIRLQYKELELYEKEALLEAHRKILLANSLPVNKSNIASGKVDASEREAFEALKRELAAQEESLKNARKMLQERDEFIEKCENELVEKSMQLTEREAWVEQREEEHEAKKNSDSRNAALKERPTEEPES